MVYASFAIRLARRPLYLAVQVFRDVVPSTANSGRREGVKKGIVQHVLR